MTRWLWLCLLFVIPTGAHAATSIVNVGGADLVFIPQTIIVNVGDTVVFVNKGGFHNAVADDKSFRCARGCDGDPGGNGSPSSSNWVANVTFTRAGTVGYYCEIHGQPGKNMFGTIIVQGANPPPPPPPDPSEVPANSGLALALLICAMLLVASLKGFAMWRERR
jgi:plastocyanin